MPINTIPPNILPRVTGKKFQKITFIKGTPDPSIGPAVCRNIFTTMCSIPMLWKAVIGRQHASIYPGTLLLTSAIVTPKQTSQFAITPLRNARNKPVLPRDSYLIITFALLI